MKNLDKKVPDALHSNLLLLWKAVSPNNVKLGWRVLVCGVGFPLPRGELPSTMLAIVFMSFWEKEKR